MVFIFFKYLYGNMCSDTTSEQYNNKNISGLFQEGYEPVLKKLIIYWRVNTHSSH